MKKPIKIIILSFYLFLFSLLPVYAKEESKEILIYIKEHEDLYLLNVDQNDIKVQIISQNTHLPISALENKEATIKSIDFTYSLNSLIPTLNTFLNKDIEYYASIDMNKVLKDLNIKANYKTPTALTKTIKQMKENLDLQLLLNYKDYLNTNLDLKTLYSFYTAFKNNDFKISYYTLPYLVYEDKYIPLETSFTLKKKMK